MEELKALIKTIKTGARPEVKAAQKQVERLFHRACRETELFKDFSIFALKADGLTRRYRTPGLLKYKYISSLPPGIYKSCQQLLNQSLLTTPELKEQLLAFIRGRQASSSLPPHSPGHA